MKITKFGHCCLLLEENGVKILTDPGSFTKEQDTITGVDIVLITHEHQDHFHLDSVKALLKNNPGVIIVTNTGVGAMLEKEGIPYTQVEDGESTELQGVKIEGFGREHAQMYGEMGKCENTGYFVQDRFYFPGDNFYKPGKPIDVLALPVAAPWLKIVDTINFAKEVKAKKAFGVHDGMIVPEFRGFVGNALKMFVPETEYIAIADGETKEF